MYFPVGNPKKILKPIWKPILKPTDDQKPETLFGLNWSLQKYYNRVDIGL